MRTLIVYASRYGLTAEAAVQLKEQLTNEVQLFDIKKEGAPDLSGFDRIIIGSPIYIGQADKTIRAFVIKNQSALLSMPLGIYLCCGLPASQDSYFSQAFPAEIVEHAVKGCFGGELRKDKMKAADRMITKMMEKATAKEGTPPPAFLTDKVAEFAKQFAEPLQQES